MKSSSSSLSLFSASALFFFLSPLEFVAVVSLALSAFSFIDPLDPVIFPDDAAAFDDFDDDAVMVPVLKISSISDALVAKKTCPELAALLATICHRMLLDMVITGFFFVRAFGS